ncbi:MAG: hypothetical protein R3E79_25165 [Caldilineaceae bacterium]
MRDPADQRQERIHSQETQHHMMQLVDDALSLVQATQENCRGIDAPDLSSFLVHVEQLMHDLWETAEAVSEAHASLASELLDLSRIYLAGEA